MGARFVGVAFHAAAITLDDVRLGLNSCVARSCAKASADSRSLLRHRAHHTAPGAEHDCLRPEQLASPRARQDGLASQHRSLHQWDHVDGWKELQGSAFSVPGWLRSSEQIESASVLAAYAAKEEVPADLVSRITGAWRRVGLAFQGNQSTSHRGGATREHGARFFT